MKNSIASVLCFAFALTGVFGAYGADTVLLEDHFDRTEQDPAQEQVGNGWGTNSKKRAKGVKQVDLRDGAMYIERADVADHGVSVTHDLEFKDATIELRFKLGLKDDLGINIADLSERSVHAGHLCMARIKLSQLEIVDLKTGRMKLENRQRRLDGSLTEAEKKAINKKSRYFKIELDADVWHHLRVSIRGDEMSVAINDQQVGKFSSAGIAHPTKRKLRLAVGKTAWVDDVLVTRHQ